MPSTDILLSIAIVGIYTMVHVYLRTEYKSKTKIMLLFIEGFTSATIITGLLYYLIKVIASWSNIIVKNFTSLILIN